MSVNATPSGLASDSACYCYGPDVAQRVKLYLLNVIAGTGQTPSQLAAGAKCYCFPDRKQWQGVVLYLQTVAAGMERTPLSTLSANSVCYCFDQTTARRVELWLLANIAGLQAQAPSALALAAVGYEFDDETARKVEAYLRCAAQSVSCDPNDLATAAACYGAVPRMASVKLYLEAAEANGGAPPEQQGALIKSDDEPGDYFRLDDGGKILVQA